MASLKLLNRSGTTPLNVTNMENMEEFRQIVFYSTVLFIFANIIRGPNSDLSIKGVHQDLNIDGLCLIVLDPLICMIKEHSGSLPCLQSFYHTVVIYYHVCCINTNSSQYISTLIKGAVQHLF